MLFLYSKRLHEQKNITTDCRANYEQNYIECIVITFSFIFIVVFLVTVLINLPGNLKYFTVERSKINVYRNKTKATLQSGKPIYLFIMHSLYLQYKIQANNSDIASGPVSRFWAYLMKVCFRNPACKLNKMCTFLLKNCIAQTGRKTLMKITISF
jgi:hypothetical protein